MTEIDTNTTETTETATPASVPKLQRLTDTEMQLVRGLAPKLHSDILATAEGAAKLERPLSDDPAAEAFIRNSAVQHRKACLAAERLLGERSGLDWAELRLRHPRRAQRLAEALLAAAESDKACAFAEDEELGTALAKQATANQLAGQLAARARQALHEQNAEDYPAWVEGAQARAENAAAAMVLAAEALEHLGRIRAQHRQAEEDAKRELDVLQHAAASLVKRLRSRRGQPLALELAPWRLNDTSRLQAWADAGLSREQALDQLGALLSRYAQAFDEATSRERAA